jgi:exonuclease SbcC
VGGTEHVLCVWGRGTHLAQLTSAELVEHARKLPSRKTAPTGLEAGFEAEQRALRELDAGLDTAIAVVNERRRSLSEHEKTRPEGLDFETAGTNHATAVTALREALEAHQAVVLQLAQDDAARRQAANLVGDLAAKDATANLWGGISDVIGSADGSKFRKFAQGLTLDALLVQANHHLASLAPRYRLERVPGEDLELQVIDRHMGDEIRALPSLSGGETFLASLALAEEQPVSRHAQVT